MSSSDIVFTSFGLIVLDEIRFTSQQSLTDVLGGSGTYGLFFLYMTAELLDVH